MKRWRNSQRPSSQSQISDGECLAFRLGQFNIMVMGSSRRSVEGVRPASRQERLLRMGIHGWMYEPIEVLGDLNGDGALSYHLYTLVL